MSNGPTTTSSSANSSKKSSKPGPFGTAGATSKDIPVASDDDATAANSPRPYSLRKRKSPVVKRTGSGNVSDASSLTDLSDSDLEKATGKGNGTTGGSGSNARLTRTRKKTAAAAAAASSSDEEDDDDEEHSDDYEDEDEAKEKRKKREQQMKAKRSAMAPVRRSTNEVVAMSLLGGSRQQQVQVQIPVRATSLPSPASQGSPQFHNLPRRATHQVTMAPFGQPGQPFDPRMISQGTTPYAPHLLQGPHLYQPQQPGTSLVLMHLITRFPDIIQNARLEATRDEAHQARSQAAIETSILRLPTRKHRSALCLTMNRYSAFCASPAVDVPAFPITSYKVALFLGRASRTTVGETFRRQMPQPITFPLPYAHGVESPASTSSAMGKGEGDVVTRELVRSWVEALGYAQANTKHIWSSIIMRHAGPGGMAGIGGAAQGMDKNILDETHIRELLSTFETLEDVKKLGFKGVLEDQDDGEEEGPGGGNASSSSAEPAKKKTKWVKGGKPVEAPKGKISSGSATPDGVTGEQSVSASPDILARAAPSPAISNGSVASSTPIINRPSVPAVSAGYYHAGAPGSRTAPVQVYPTPPIGPFSIQPHAVTMGAQFPGQIAFHPGAGAEQIQQQPHSVSASHPTMVFSTAPTQTQVPPRPGATFPGYVNNRFNPNIPTGLPQLQPPPGHPLAHSAAPSGALVESGKADPAKKSPATLSRSNSATSSPNVGTLKPPGAVDGEGAEGGNGGVGAREPRVRELSGRSAAEEEDARAMPPPKIPTRPGSRAGSTSSASGGGKGSRPSSPAVSAMASPNLNGSIPQKRPFTSEEKGKQPVRSPSLGQAQVQAAPQVQTQIPPGQRMYTTPTGEVYFAGGPPGVSQGMAAQFSGMQGMHHPMQMQMQGGVQGYWSGTPQMGMGMPIGMGMGMMGMGAPHQQNQQGQLIQHSVPGGGGAVSYAYPFRPNEAAVALAALSAPASFPAPYQPQPHPYGGYTQGEGQPNSGSMASSQQSAPPPTTASSSQDQRQLPSLDTSNMGGAGTMFTAALSPSSLFSPGLGANPWSYSYGAPPASAGGVSFDPNSNFAKAG